MMDEKSSSQQLKDLQVEVLCFHDILNTLIEGSKPEHTESLKLVKNAYIEFFNIKHNHGTTEQSTDN